MDDGEQRATSRAKADHYKSVRTQWIISQGQIKDQQSMKLAQAMAERDAAIYERNVAIAQKKTAIAERDVAVMQRDQALNDINKVIMERESAIAALEYARENSRNGNGPTCAPAPNCSPLPISKPMHHEAPYCSREIHISEAYPISSNADNVANPRQAKWQPNDTNVQGQMAITKGKPRNGKKERGLVKFGKQNMKTKQLECKEHDMTSEDLNKVNSVIKHGWKGQDIGLNNVIFDESIMPIPGCSCTGVWRQCYKWGNGGWQSACCITALSMYPLPMLPHRKHARVGGRKMSGSAFNKLLSRLAAEGHDLSIPIDLRSHWAKHGTNRYITIR